jgi:hypothetical protein
MFSPNYFKEETRQMIKQSARAQVRLALMIQIVKARESHDYVNAQKLTQMLREIVDEENSEKEEKKKEEEAKQESRFTHHVEEERRMEMAKGASSSGRVQIL